MNYSVLFIGPRGDCWQRAPRPIEVCELAAVGHLEPWTFWTSLWGREIRDYFVIFP